MISGALCLQQELFAHSTVPWYVSNCEEVFNTGSLIWDKGKSLATGHLIITEIAIPKLNRNLLASLSQFPEEGAVLLFKILSVPLAELGSGLL